MPDSHSIGAHARRTCVHITTFRYYVTVGFVPKPSRTAANRRVYGDDTVRRLQFVRHARELGFELPAIRQLLALADQPQKSCEAVDAIARTHLREINSRIERLTVLQSEMRRMLRQCKRDRIAECRIIEVLGHHEFRSRHKH
jgi:DNA-binding transcriptional MerR regulator